MTADLPTRAWPEGGLAPGLAEDRRHPTMLADVLRDICELLGGDEAVFFRFNRMRDALEATAWSTQGAPRPESFQLEWIPYVQRAAREQSIHVTDGPNGPTLVAAPVHGDTLTIGALSVSAVAGLPVDADEVRRRLPKYAAMLARVSDLLEARREAALENRRVNSVLGAVQNFQTMRTPQDLARAICDASLQITSGDGATLVRWHAGEGKGEVDDAIGESAPVSGLAVSPDSLVGRVCQSGLPQVWESARLATQVQPVYSYDEPGRTVESLGIYPLKNRELQVVGAIVVEGATAGAIRIKAMRDVRLLSIYAAMSLETVWEIAEVTRRARTDALTGLPNRRHFDERLTWVLDEADRFGVAAALLVVDVDHFKSVNDQHGHEAGDEVLKQIARILGEGVRAVDLCARLGGEEFAIILPQTDVAGAMELGERLRRAIETEPAVHDDIAIPVTASFGVATYPELTVDRDELFAAADAALYDAKRNGRNQVRAFVGAISG